MGDLTETYPRLADKIGQARQAGYSDEEIQSHLQGKMQQAFKAGYSVDEVNSYLGDVGPSKMQKLAIGPAGDVVQETLEGLAAPAEAIGTGAGGMLYATAQPVVGALGGGLAMLQGKTAPEVYESERQAQSLLESAKPFIAPEPTTPLAKTATEVAAAPFTAGQALLEKTGIPPEEAQSLVTAAGAALPFVMHLFGGTPESAVSDSGASGLASRVFKSLFDRNPKNVGEIQRTYRDEPVFAEAMNEELSKAAQRPEPTAQPPESAPAEASASLVKNATPEPAEPTAPPELTAKGVVDRIESQQNPEHFDREEITKKVEDGGDTYVKTTVSPDDLATRRGVKPGESVPEKGAIVADDEGKVIDGNHRVVDAKAAGEQSVEAYVPKDSDLAPAAASNRGAGETASAAAGEPSIEDRIKALEEENAKLRQQQPGTTAQPEQPKAPKPSQRLEDTEVRPSTYIKRQGGMRIPPELKEEFGGWNRLNTTDETAMSADEMAHDMYDKGMLPEPTTNALIDALKNKGRSARPANFNDQVEADMQDHINTLKQSTTGVEYKGHDYEGIEEAGKGKYKLKDDPDKIITRKQALEADEKIPFDIPTGEEVSAHEPVPPPGGDLRPAIRLNDGRTIIGEPRTRHDSVYRELTNEQRGMVKDTGWIGKDGKFMTADEATEYNFRNEAQPAKSKVGDVQEASRAAESKNEPSVKTILQSERGAIELPDLSAEYDSAKKSLERTQKVVDHLNKARKVKAAMAYSKDAGDNAAALFGRQMGNDIRGALRRAFGKDSGKAEEALSFVVEADNQPGKIEQFRDQIMNSDNSPAGYKRRMPGVLDFARDHWDTLNQVAQRYGDITDKELADENANGVPTPKRSGGYVMHVHDVPDEGLGYLAGGGNEPTGFRHIRTHATFADAISAGLDPKTVNAPDLLEARLSRGQRMIANKEWVKGLRDLNDPQTGAPIVADMKVTQRADGSVDAVPPDGYSVQRVGFQPVAVKNGYEGTFSALTDPSWFSKSIASRSFMRANALGKSVNLLFDTFHLARVAYWESLIKGLGIKTFETPLPSYRKGVTLMDYTPEEIGRMAQAGEIPQEWVGTLQDELRKTKLAVQTGYNVGRISDALHQDWVHNVKGIGDYNKWLFDKFQRGAMREVWSLEYDRLKNARPEMSDLEAARKVSADLNTRFGNLGRQGIFKSRTSQDLARALVLAPQWNEGLIKSEIGAVRQAGEFGVDLAKGRSIYAGVLLRSVGAMVLGQFVANQIINQYTRGNFTWENPEEGMGAKLSAWIPDVIGGGPGFFLHPFGLAAETTHLLMQGYERTDDWHKTLMTYLRSRSSAAMRPVLTFLTNEDFLGRTLKPGTVWSEIVKSAVPLPIASSAITGALKQGFTGQEGETFPGQFQKQLMASAGVKTDQAPSPEQRISRLAREFNTQRGVPPNPAFYSGDYEDLSGALRMNNTDAASQAMDELLQKKTPVDVLKHYRAWAGRPFTGSNAQEYQFVRGLSPEEREQYVAARQARRQASITAINMLRQKLGGLRHAIMPAVNE